jgi:N6-adenosine-specific RNA methylase IME4
MTLYSAIVADPPWPLAWRGGGQQRRNGRGEVHPNGRAGVTELPYPVMSIADLKALPVGELAAPAAHLYLWTPDRMVMAGTAARVAEAWGFTPFRLLVWRKPGMDLGRFPRPAHELVMICRRGRLGFKIAHQPSVQDWKHVYTHRVAGGRVVTHRDHSRKPEGLLDLVEQASPGPYLELFSRHQRIGWDTWGDEALNPTGIDLTPA